VLFSSLLLSIVQRQARWSIWPTLAVAIWFSITFFSYYFTKYQEYSASYFDSSTWQQAATIAETGNRFQWKSQPWARSSGNNISLKYIDMYLFEAPCKQASVHGHPSALEARKHMFLTAPSMRALREMQKAREREMKKAGTEPAFSRN
jgi:hypothetical protein